MVKVSFNAVNQRSVSEQNATWNQATYTVLYSHVVTDSDLLLDEQVQEFNAELQDLGNSRRQPIEWLAAAVLGLPIEQLRKSLVVFKLRYECLVVNPRQQT